MTEESLQFHIQENDCFGTLATVVDQVRQALKKRGKPSEVAALAGVRDQLMYLQHEYRLQNRHATAVEPGLRIIHNASRE